MHVLEYWITTYNLIVAFMMREKTALVAKETVLEMQHKLCLTSTWFVALVTGYRERARFCVIVELSLAWKDALASYALEVIFGEVIVQCGLA
jgi:hypothetical protein